jgi:putative ABC transport system permease protein
MLDVLNLEIRYAVRALLQRPSFAFAAVLTLALGIGANAGIFSVVYGILLRPLPYDEADRLALVDARRDVAGTQQPVRTYFPLAELETFRARSASFESIAFYATDEGIVSNGRGTELVDFATVSESFFSTLRGRLLLGRALGPSDDMTASIVISERLWRRLYAGSANALGQNVMLHSRRGDGSQREQWRRTPFTIVGVARSSLQFPSPQTDVWTAAGFIRTLNPRCCSFLPLARLSSRATLNQATTEVNILAQALSTTNAAAHRGLLARAIGLHEQLVLAVQPSLLILMAAVAMVLIVACANVTNLLLARNVTRAREIAVRLALGASRARLVVQSVIEGGLLVTLGGGAGMLLAAGMVKTLHRLKPTDIPLLEAVRLDVPVLLFGCAVAAVATLITGLVPALQSERSIALRMSGNGMMSSPAGSRAHRALLVLEVAVSVVLLVGATLLARSLVYLLYTDLGVVTDRVITASMSLTLDRELGGAQQIALTNRVLDRLRELPGVSSVGVGTSLPPNESRILLTLTGNNAVDYQASAVPSTPGYFSALGVHLLKGRFFTDSDDADHPPVMIMSSDTARHFFGDSDPIGRTLFLPIFRDGTQRQTTMTLVGVIDNVKYSGLERPPGNVIYRPFAQQPWPNVFLVARTDGDTTALRTTLQRQIAAVDRAIAVSAISTLDDVVSEAAGPPRFRTLLLAALALLALALAIVGLYGVVSYSVSQRTTEIGIRMALGGTTRDVVTMIVGEGMALALGGVVIGVAGAYALSRTLAALLYGVGPSDPVSFALASGSFILFAVLASYVPARRATRIEPAVALRAE